jgi:hypothetical protein
MIEDISSSNLSTLWRLAMKPTLELQQIVSALGIDPFRFLAWQEKELAEKLQNAYLEEHKEFDPVYGLVV